jgi:hypothetical protein
MFDSSEIPAPVRAIRYSAFSIRWVADTIVSGISIDYQKICPPSDLYSGLLAVE